MKENNLKEKFMVSAYYKYVGNNKKIFNKAREKFGVLIAYSHNLYDYTDYMIDIAVTYYDPYKKKEVEKINGGDNILLTYYYYSVEKKCFVELNYLKEYKILPLNFFKKNFIQLNGDIKKSIIRELKIKSILE
jgi:hypothetical protein